MDVGQYILWIGCFAVTILVSITIGYIWGVRRENKAGGEIIFRSYSDGSESCVFNLKGDIDWMKDQKTIIFRVRRETIDKPRYDDDTNYAVAPREYPQA